MPMPDRLKKILNFVDDIRPVMTGGGFERRVARRAKSIKTESTITVGVTRRMHSYPVPEVTAVAMTQFDVQYGIQFTHIMPGRMDITYFRTPYSFPIDRPILISEKERLEMGKALREAKDHIVGNIGRRAPEAKINVVLQKIKG